MSRSPFAFATIILAALYAQPAASLVIGQIDTFEDGTTQGWGVGAPHPEPPVNVATGGPAGADDNYLLLTALGGDGPGARLSVQNLGQWAGDYSAAGIGTISMDVSNLGNTDLYLRLLFTDPVAGPPTNLAFTTDAVFVAAGAGWTNVTFSIASDDLTAGLGSISDALQNTTELRLYHSFAPSFPSPGSPLPAVVTELGVDNIRAGSPVIPEPTTTGLFGAALLAWFARRRLAPARH